MMSILMMSIADEDDRFGSFTNGRADSKSRHVRSAPKAEVSRAGLRDAWMTNRNFKPIRLAETHDYPLMPNTDQWASGPGRPISARPHSSTIWSAIRMC